MLNIIDYIFLILLALGTVGSMTAAVSRLLATHRRESEPGLARLERKIDALARHAGLPGVSDATSVEQVPEEGKNA